MNTDADEDLFLCSHCDQNTDRFPAGRLYVEWSDKDTVEGDGCVAEMFCSWECAGRWFSRGRPRIAFIRGGYEISTAQ
jgi:hypothetical protein